MCARGGGFSLARAGDNMAARAQSHLVEEAHMPQDMLDYMAMVHAYSVLRVRWGRGDLSELFSPLRMPPGLLPHVRDTFDALKARQAALAGADQGSAVVASALVRWLPASVKRFAASQSSLAMVAPAVGTREKDA